MRKIFISLSLFWAMCANAQIAQLNEELFPNTPFDATTSESHYDADGVSDQTIREKLLADPTKWYQTTASGDYAGAVVEDDGYQIASLLYKKPTNWYTNFICTRSTAKIVAGVYRISLKARVQDATEAVPFYLKIGRWDEAAQAGGTEISIKRLGETKNVMFSKGNSSGSIKFTPSLSKEWTECSADVYVEEAIDETAFMGRMFFSFPEFAEASATSSDGSIRIDIKDVSMKLIGELPPPAENVYVRNTTDEISWSNIKQDEKNIIVSTDNISEIPEGRRWLFAPGKYYLSGMQTIDATEMYGGFTGQENIVDDDVIAKRERIDIDNNGLVEPWEMKNIAYFQQYDETKPETAANLRFTIQKQSVIDGITIRNINSSYKSTVCVGPYIDPDKPVTSVPEDQKGIMRNSIMYKVDCGAFLAINNYSVVDGCLIEECTATNYNRAIAIPGYKAVLRNSKVRNNQMVGSNVYFLIPRVAMEGATPTVENCIFHNNNSSSYGFARVQAASKDQVGCNFINCTFKSNKCTYELEFIGASGNVMNCLICNYGNNSIRDNSSAGQTLVNVFNSITNKNVTGANIVLYDTPVNVSSADMNLDEASAAVVTKGYVASDAEDYENYLKSTLRTTDYIVYKDDENTKTLYGVSSATYTDLRSNPVTLNAPETDILGNAQPEGKQAIGAFVPSSTTNIGNVNNDVVVNFDGAKVEVYNQAGMLVKESVINGSLSELNGLNQGLYIVKVSNGSHTMVKKIIVR